MITYVNEAVVDFLMELFNKLSDQEQFPREWSKSIIVPVHMKGNVNRPDNYRGIAFASAMSKV